MFISKLKLITIQILLKRIIMKLFVTILILFPQLIGMGYLRLWGFLQNALI